MRFFWFLCIATVYLIPAIWSEVKISDAVEMPLPVWLCFAVCVGWAGALYSIAVYKMFFGDDE